MVKSGSPELVTDIRNSKAMLAVDKDQVQQQSFETSKVINANSGAKVAISKDHSLVGTHTIVTAFKHNSINGRNAEVLLGDVDELI